MTKLFKSINISLVAAIIMIVATALNFADEIKLTAYISGGGNEVRGVSGVIGNPDGTWPAGNSWEDLTVSNHQLLVGQGLSVGYSEPTDNFSVNGTALITGNVTFENGMYVTDDAIVGGDLTVSGGITTDADMTVQGQIGTADSLNAAILLVEDSADPRVTIDGEIYQSGNLIHPDYVFEPDYKLESIEEHARVMWEEKRLPAIPVPEKADGGTYVTEIGSQQRGLLEELEKAHIYVTRLKEMLDKQGERITRLENKHD